MKHTTIAIIGAGRVGATTAHALMLQNVAAEILLVDVNEKRCQGEVYDLTDVLPFSQTSCIRTASPREAAQADIIIIAAGAAQKPHQPRSELLSTNKKVIATIFDSLKPIRKDAIIIMVTNPVDQLTLYAQEIAGLPRNQIFGSGTILDTQRLRGIIANKVAIAEESIHVYVLGEHGESQFVAWSAARIGGVPFNNFPELTAAFLKSAAEQAQQRVYEIIACKEATYFGVATCVSALCADIVYDQKRAVPLSCYSEKYGVCLSVPAILGAHGIEKLLPLQLDKAEHEALEKSVQRLKTL